MSIEQAIERLGTQIASLEGGIRTLVGQLRGDYKPDAPSPPPTAPATTGAAPAALPQAEAVVTKPAVKKSPAAKLQAALTTTATPKATEPTGGDLDIFDGPEPKAPPVELEDIRKAAQALQTALGAGDPVLKILEANDAFPLSAKIKEADQPKRRKVLQALQNALPKDSAKAA